MPHEIAEKIRELLLQDKNVPKGLLVAAEKELDRMKVKLESANIPWAGFTDRNKNKNK